MLTTVRVGANPAGTFPLDRLSLSLVAVRQKGGGPNFLGARTSRAVQRDTRLDLCACSPIPGEHRVGERDEDVKFDGASRGDVAVEEVGDPANGVASTPSAASVSSNASGGYARTLIHRQAPVSRST